MLCLLAVNKLMLIRPIEFCGVATAVVSSFWSNPITVKWVTLSVTRCSANDYKYGINDTFEGSVTVRLSRYNFSWLQAPRLRCCHWYSWRLLRRLRKSVYANASGAFEKLWYVGAKFGLRSCLFSNFFCKLWPV